MITVRDLAAILTTPHLRGTPSQDGMVYGTEPGLLVQLEEAIGSTVSSVSGGGSDPRTRSPIDLGAADLLREIRTLLEREVPAACRVFSTLSLVDVVVSRTTDEDRVHRMFETWIDRIREHLDPTPRRPLPGIACPSCLATALPRLLDGDHVMVPPITIWPRSLTAECQSCEATWTGREALLKLACDSPSS